MSQDPNIKSTHIDLLNMARFLVLPGAADLLTAFAAIPPGALRESVIAHARVIAQTYAGAPAEMHMPDPLLTAAQAAPAPPALPKPARAPKTAEEAIMAQRLAGAHPADIARTLSTTRLKVDAVLREARAAGVKLPPPKTNTAPPAKMFPLKMADVDPRGAGVIRIAAAKRGMTIEQYIRARSEFVRLRRAKQPMDEIAKAIRIDEKTCWQWLYVARRAGLDLAARLDFDDAEFTPGTPQAPQPPEAEVVPIRPPKPAKTVTVLQPGQLVFGTFEAMNGGAQHRLASAAQARGLTVGAYMQLRESIVRQRLANVPIREIIVNTGQTYNMVKDTMQIAVSRGVVFPPAVPSPPYRKAGHA
jgi:hypothetical protein